MEKIKNIIQQYYDTFNRQDIEGFLALLDHDVIHDINQGSTEIGKSAFSLFMQQMNEFYQEKVKDLIIMVSENTPHAAARFIVEGTYLKTAPGLPSAKGQRYELPVLAFFEIEHDKIKRISNYYNLNDWLKQVNQG